MVTKERPINMEEGSLWLPWDHFLEQEVNQSSIDADPELRAMRLAHTRRHIDSFRENEWKPIVRELSKSFNWFIPVGLEPHWTAPGKAIYWQEQIVRKPSLVTGEDGTKRRVMQDVRMGWEPITSGLPASNASIIAHYLEKGFRLRPPQDGVSLETREAAKLSEVSQEPEPPKQLPYVCHRHIDLGSFGFATWRGYLKHCDHFDEEIESDLPEEAKARMREFPYYCVRHDIPFKNSRGAARHRWIESRRQSSKRHATVDEMKTTKD